jgi:hypothetical protein
MDDAPLDQQRRFLKVEISPLKPNNFTTAKSQTPSDQDHGPIRFPNVQPELVKLLGRQDGWPFQTLADVLHSNQLQGLLSTSSQR